MKAVVVGAGVAGLVCATELLDRGFAVQVFEQGSRVGTRACSWYAGGMLAPWCERESAEQAVIDLGRESIHWWERHTGSVNRRGSLVVAPARDRSELQRFGRRTSMFEWVDGGRIAELEPDLAGRFNTGLYFSQEAHIDPRQAMQRLADHLIAAGASLVFDTAVDPDELAADITCAADVVLDCRGFAARAAWPGMRGVKGEMLIVRCPDFALSRPVRLLHPRIPLYVVPRADHHFMIGATMIESEDRHRISVRSMLELLGSAYALNPVLGEAEILETGVDVRPAWPDNLPRVIRRGKILGVNGFYRHGFLLSPAMARLAADEAIAMAGSDRTHASHAL